mmetsp:Transcript_26869/g.38113  ORF Transcript_26869/g.38113 Transcript_26869/m.38113 type:complete len:247 (+) Transcript_26869:67-807(+)
MLVYCTIPIRCFGRDSISGQSKPLTSPLGLLMGTPKNVATEYPPVAEHSTQPDPHQSLYEVMRLSHEMGAEVCVIVAHGETIQSLNQEVCGISDELEVPYCGIGVYEASFVSNIEKPVLRFKGLMTDTPSPYASESTTESTKLLSNKAIDSAVAIETRKERNEASLRVVSAPQALSNLTYKPYNDLQEIKVTKRLQKERRGTLPRHTTEDNRPETTETTKPTATHLHQREIPCNSQSHQAEAEAET